MSNLRDRFAHPAPVERHSLDQDAGLLDLRQILGILRGGYRTIGSIENTTDVWDGVVPYVIGSTMASNSSSDRVLLPR